MGPVMPPQGPQENVNYYYHSRYMPKYAEIKDDKVVNIVEAENECCLPAKELFLIDEEDDSIAIGSTREGGVFRRPPEPVRDALEEILEKRQQAYGSVEKQIEFITENGLEAWQDKVAEIKAQYPKP